MIIQAHRFHDFSYGHLVSGHENKCRHLHGHNGRVHFTVQAPELDRLGRVMDFSVINSKLCQWVEANWDHRFLIWEGDSVTPFLRSCDPEGVIEVPFIPTAERMAQYLLEIIGPRQLEDTEVELIRVTLEETRKCHATASL